MTRRRSRSSSAPPPRPRRIAGRDLPDRPMPEEPREVESTTEEPALEVPPTRVDEPEPESPRPPQEPGPEPDESETHGDEPEPGHEAPDEQLDELDDPSRPGFTASPTTTRVLLVLLVVLAVAALAGGGYLLWHERSSGEEDAAPRATDERPVRITIVDAQRAVAAAAEGAETIISTSYQDFDKQLAESLELMTPEFAEQFRETSADVENDVVKNKTEVEVEVRAQGVHRADARQVEALIFLNQLVTKNGKDPVLSPYRVLVTMERTSDGWLVAGLDTK